MKIYIPYKNWIITQKYAENANTYYAEKKRKGHGAFDIVGMGDKTVYASCDSFVYSVRNKGNPDPMQYRAVYTLIDDNGIWYELVYGHCSDIYIESGNYVKKGDKLALEGNTGDVASGGRKITKAEKLKGSTAGSHTHWQLRLLRPVPKMDKGQYLIGNDLKAFKKDGMYFEVLNYDNGYLGCIDPEPFVVYESAVPKTIIEKVSSIFKPQFKRVLRYGMKGDDVKALQNLLMIKPDGVFGYQTEQTVRAFQKARKLTVDGIAGPQTINAL